MKRIHIAVMMVLTALSLYAVAQGPPPMPKAPTPIASSGGQTCDMIGVIDSDVTIAGVAYDAGYMYTFGPAIPIADVNDNHAKWMKVLSVASEQQDKGGPYSSELSEYRSCDGGGVVKISDGSILIQGMTLAGVTRVNDEGLKQARAINDRTKQRVRNQHSTDHDHTKAKKVKRNDLGIKQRDEPGK